MPSQPLQLYQGEESTRQSEQAILNILHTYDFLVQPVGFSADLDLEGGGHDLRVWAWRGVDGHEVAAHAALGVVLAGVIGCHGHPQQGTHPQHPT